MWYQKYRDEEKEADKSRIFRELYYLMMAFATLSIIFKAFRDPGNWKASLFEILLIIFSAVYYIVRSVMKGLYEETEEELDPDYRAGVSRRNILVGAGLGLAFALLFGILNAVLFGTEGTTFKVFALNFLGTLVWYTPFFVAIMFLADKLMDKAYERKYAELDNEMDWEEDDEDE